MPRDLDDVLHYFLPVPERSDDLAREREPDPPAPVALPILTLPVASRDVVRAAFAWNLTVELARLGARAVMIAPHDPAAAPLWPEPGRGPLGAQMSCPAARDIVALGLHALDAAIANAPDAPEGGIVVACVPPEWLVRGAAVRSLLRWMLLFGTPEPDDLREVYAMTKLAYRRGSDPLIGLVIHGVHRLREAERAFAHVARVAARHLGRSPQSYGLLADDLHVYRAIAARRPIGIEHPQSRAARALGDVARMIWSDAQKMALA
ncbi:MAG TPA: hypothetical protein VKH41_14940 [Myxococcota bacterium]|nr:hypothetical protein [Myxococcota bacterium]